MRISIAIPVALILAATAGYNVRALAEAPAASAPSPAVPNAKATAAPKGGADRLASIEEIPEPPTPDQKQFGDRLVQIIQAKDQKGLLATLSPETRACFEKTDQNYVNRWVHKQLRFGVTPDYELTVAKLTSNASKDNEFRTFKLPATHALNIKYNTTGGEITLMRLIGKQNGTWYLAAPCPTEAGVARLHKAEQVREEARKRADQLYPKMPVELTTRLKTLITSGQHDKALRVCAQSMKVDMFTAQLLLAKIEGTPSEKKL